MIFAPTFYSSTIPTEQNTSKDFSLSYTDEESDQSITSFSETLPDDILFYPDALTNDIIIVASSGTGDYGDAYGDYRDSWIYDSYCFGDHSSPYYFTLEFILSDSFAVTVDSFDININFEIGTNQSSYLYNYETLAWDLIGVMDTWTAGDFWLNVTVGQQYISTDEEYYQTIEFASDGQTGEEAWYTEADYVCIRNFKYMTPAYSEYNSIQKASYGYDNDDDALTEKYNSYTATRANTTTVYDPSSPISPDNSFVMAWGYSSISCSATVEFNFTVPVTYSFLTLDTRMSGSHSSTSLATVNGTLGGNVWGIYIYNFDTSAWVTLNTKNSGWSWGYQTQIDIDNDAYIKDSDRTVWVRYKITSSSVYTGIWLYHSIIWCNEMSSYGSHYAESFADVSDWEQGDYAMEAGDGFSSDGDLLHLDYCNT